MQSVQNTCSKKCIFWNCLIIFSWDKWKVLTQRNGFLLVSVLANVALKRRLFRKIAFMTSFKSQHTGPLCIICHYPCIKERESASLLLCMPVNCPLTCNSRGNRGDRTERVSLGSSQKFVVPFNPGSVELYTLSWHHWLSLVPSS